MKKSFGKIKSRNSFKVGEVGPNYNNLHQRRKRKRKAKSCQQTLGHAPACLGRAYPLWSLFPARYRVVVSYPPQSEAEIELKEGDIVFVHKKREDGWYKGTLQRNGRTGLFPGSFVESF